MNLKTLVFIIIFSLIFSCSKKGDNSTIAEFDTGTITLNEVVKTYNELSQSEKDRIKNKDDAYKFVRRLALERIIIDRAKEDRLNQTEDYENRMKEVRNTTAYNYLKNKNVVSKIKIDEADLNKYSKKFSLYQIVKRHDILDENKIIEGKKLLETLSKKITDLNSFKESAKKYSDDITSVNGGFVGDIRLGIMEDEIDSVMKKLKPQKVSNVIETSLGYHLIFIDKIEELSKEELLADKELYDTIYKEKEEELEKKWFDKILVSHDLQIFNEKLKSKKYDEEVLVKYKEKSITRKEFFNIVDGYTKDNGFPDPTLQELEGLLRNMSINLAIKSMIFEDEVEKSEEFKKIMVDKEKMSLINEFIEKNIVIQQISESEIKDFYNKNLNALFTFKQEDGKMYVQKIDEVKKFISQKLEQSKIQEARYDLYRKVVNDNKLVIDDNVLDVFLKKVEI